MVAQVLGSSTLSGSYRFWTQPTETSSDPMGGGFDELGGRNTRWAQKTVLNGAGNSYKLI